MKKSYSISIIVPVYNEIQLIEDSVHSITSFVSKHFEDYEIIIVESGSTDGTAQVCSKMEQVNSHVKVIHEGARNGFGSALKLGYKNATKDLLWMITVDLPFPLDSILQALPLLDYYDCVLSYRSTDKRVMWRKLQSFVYNWLVKKMFGLKTKHVNSAFKVFKKQVIQEMVLYSNGWIIDVEITYRLKENNIHFIEIPTEFTERLVGKSSINIFTSLSILREIFLLLLKVRENSHQNSGTGK